MWQICNSNMALSKRRGFIFWLIVSEGSSSPRCLDNGRLVCRRDYKRLKNLHNSDRPGESASARFPGSSGDGLPQDNQTLLYEVGIHFLVWMDTIQTLNILSWHYDFQWQNRAIIQRPQTMNRIYKTFEVHPIAGLLGPRQCGKATLARMMAGREDSTFFDLENPVDLRRLSSPMQALEGLSGLVVVDEVQRKPSLF